MKDKTGNETTLEIGDNINTIGGAIVKTKNGEIEVNNTIEARLLRFKKSLRSEVASIYLINRGDYNMAEDITTIVTTLGFPSV